MNLTLGSIYS
jgi:hypothetical protein